MNPQNICTAARWGALSERLGIAQDLRTYGALIKAHAEPHRAYHTLDHIAACLKHLDATRDLAKKPDEIEMALWFHDAIYDPFSARNEEDSAEWAADWLQEHEISSEVIIRITDHILATKTHDKPGSTDGQLMLDIDLSILGTVSEVYEEFEQNIRREYRRVPRFIFRKKRKAILQRFADRSRIYFTDYFHAKLDRQARLNLTWAMSNL